MKKELNDSKVWLVRTIAKKMAAGESIESISAGLLARVAGNFLSDSALDAGGYAVSGVGYAFSNVAEATGRGVSGAGTLMHAGVSRFGGRLFGRFESPRLTGAYNQVSGFFSHTADAIGGVFGAGAEAVSTRYTRHVDWGSVPNLLWAVNEGSEEESAASLALKYILEGVRTYQNEKRYASLLEANDGLEQWQARIRTSEEANQSFNRSHRDLVAVVNGQFDSLDLENLQDALRLITSEGGREFLQELVKLPANYLPFVGNAGTTSIIEDIALIADAPGEDLNHLCALVGELGKLKQSFPNLEQGSVDYRGLVGQIYTTSKSYAKILSGSRISQMQAIGMVQSCLPEGLGSATDSILRDISQFDESQVANIAYLLNSLMNAPAGMITKERRLRAGLEGISKIDPASLDVLAEVYKGIMAFSEHTESNSDMARHVLAECIYPLAALDDAQIVTLKDSLALLIDPHGGAHAAIVDNVIDLSKAFRGSDYQSEAKLAHIDAVIDIAERLATPDGEAFDAEDLRAIHVASKTSLKDLLCSDLLNLGDTVKHSVDAFSKLEAADVGQLAIMIRHGEDASDSFSAELSKSSDTANYSDFIGHLSNMAKGYSNLSDNARRTLAGSPLYDLVKSYLPEGMLDASGRVLTDIAGMSNAHLGNVSYLLTQFMTAASGEMTKETRLRSALTGVVHLGNDTVDALAKFYSGITTISSKETHEDMMVCLVEECIYPFANLNDANLGSVKQLLAQLIDPKAPGSEGSEQISQLNQFLDLSRAFRQDGRISDSRKDYVISKVRQVFGSFGGERAQRIQESVVEKSEGLTMVAVVETLLNMKSAHGLFLLLTLIAAVAAAVSPAIPAMIIAVPAVFALAAYANAMLNVYRFQLTTTKVQDLMIRVDPETNDSKISFDKVIEHKTQIGLELSSLKMGTIVPIMNGFLEAVAKGYDRPANAVVRNKLDWNAVVLSKQLKKDDEGYESPPGSPGAMKKQGK